MLIYFLLLLIPVVMGIMHANGLRSNDAIVFSFYIILAIFSGLRYEVGADWTGYLRIFDTYAGLILSDGLLEHEPGFFMVNYLSNVLGFDIYGVNIFSACVFLFGVFIYARKTANPWLALSVVMPFLFFIISLSGIRQSAALGIGLIVFAYSESLSLIFKSLLILLACSFHNSAVVLFLFIVIDLRVPVYLKIISVLAVLALIYQAMQGTDIVNTYNSRYLVQNVESTGAFYHVMLSAFPGALYLLFQKRISAAGMARTTVKVGSYLSIAALPMILVSSTGTSRIVLYLSFIQMWIYPALIQTFKETRGVWVAGCVIVTLGIFVVYFQFGKTVFQYLPYRNLLFLE